MVDVRAIEMGHARALLSLDEELQVEAAREVVNKRLSVRETENLVRRLLHPKKRTGAGSIRTFSACRTVLAKTWAPK